ncbi:sodium-coupled monocarboxylate transporter 1-like [Glandiceps talaboti]
MSDYELLPSDIAVFGAILLFVAGQGIYHGWKKQKSTREYLTANRSLSGVPVAMSLLVSFMSAITLLGTPAEIYLYGTGYTAGILSYFWVYPFVTWFFVPVFQPLPLTSAYQYCEWRYNYTLRVLMAMLCIFQTTFYMAVVLIGPALAFEAVNGIPLIATVVGTACICIFYTTLGGMKAVIWTDAFLFMVILIDLIIVIILGTVDSGGFSYVWEVNKADGRLAESIFYFPLDMTARVTFINMVIGGGMNFLGVFVSQTSIQRFVSTRSMKHAKISVILNLPFQLMFLPLVFVCGLVLYAHYNNFLSQLAPPINSTFSPALTFPPYGHDDTKPHYEPYYTSADQILIFFVSEKFGHIPGFMGLFIACIFAGTLSSFSSSLNALIAVTLEDFVKPWRRWRAKRTGNSVYVNDRVDTIAGKMLSVAYGLFAIFLAYLASFMGNFVTMGNTIFGTSGGPMIGALCLGFIYKRSTAWATVGGVLTGFGMGCWVAVGAVIYTDRLDEVLGIYSLSFMWYSTFSFLITILVAILLSEIHRWFSKKERDQSKEIDPALLASFMRPKGWKSIYVQDESDDEEKREIKDGEEGNGTKDETIMTAFTNIGNDTIRYGENDESLNISSINTTNVTADVEVRHRENLRMNNSINDFGFNHDNIHNFATECSHL